MKYVVLGAGAVGGVIGGLLHAAGTPTTLLARGPHLDTLRRDGLLLDVGDDRLRLHVPVVGSPGEIDWTDDTVVLLTVKSQQTAAALGDLAAHAPRSTPVVCAQNGLSNEREALRRFARVQGLCVMLPSNHLSPGHVAAHSRGRPGLLDLGCAPDGVDEVSRSVAADLRAAGFESEPRPDVMAWKRRKLLLNLGNAVDAACAEDDDAARLTALAREEGERVLAAAGLPVVSEEADRERRGERLRPLTRRDEAGSSSWQSLRRGTGVEVDHLNGEVVLLGRLHGVPTPVNALLQDALGRLAHAGGPPRSLAAGDLLAHL